MSVIANQIADLAIELAEDYMANICKEDFLQAISHMSIEELEELFENGYQSGFRKFCMRSAVETAKMLSELE